MNDLVPVPTPVNNKPLASPSWGRWQVCLGTHYGAKGHCGPDIFHTLKEAQDYQAVLTDQYKKDFDVVRQDV